MPELDGCATTRLIRQDPRHAETPVVAMTAHAMQRDRDLCLAAGMVDFISKPFEPQHLFATIARWLPEVAPDVSPDGPAAVPGVDFSVGLRRCMGRQDLHLRVLNRFVQTHSGRGSQVRQALQQGDRKGACLSLHSLVSSGGMIGAETLAERAGQLDALLRESDAPVPDDALRRFEEEEARALAEIARYLARA